ncbi:MAG: hypothetical protein ACRCZK_01845 [Oscillospiraceae bacterium]
MNIKVIDKKDVAKVKAIVYIFKIINFPIKIIELSCLPFFAVAYVIQDICACVRELNNFLLRKLLAKYLFKKGSNKR